MNVTNQLARLRIDIPALGWKLGDQVCIKEVSGEGDTQVAAVEHAQTGETLTNLAMIFLETEHEKVA